jgi:hypothetical protein
VKAKTVPKRSYDPVQVAPLSRRTRDGEEPEDGAGEGMAMAVVRVKKERRVVLESSCMLMVFGIQGRIVYLILS